MATTEQATFAAGCFWGVEAAFRELPGVLDVEVGYTGGTKANPSYPEVCTGRTGHAEAVRVEYDPAVIGYDALLDAFFSIHDPTTPNRQGHDIGTQYRSAIFHHDDAQRRAARIMIERVEAGGRYGRPVVTEVAPAGEFYRAEEYHQRYYEKRGIRRC
jgi:peptide-methionine (S)-S-oxide reductase